MFGSSMQSPDFICSDNGLKKYVWKAAEKREKEKESQKAAHSQIISQAHADVEDSYVCVFGSVLVCLFHSFIRPVFIRFSCIYVCLNAIIRRPDYEIFVVLRTVESSRVETSRDTHCSTHESNFNEPNTFVYLFTLILYIPCISLILFLQFLAHILILNQK